MINNLRIMQTAVDKGFFQAKVVSMVGNSPISGATVRVTDINYPDQIIEELTTDTSGLTETITLDTPPLEYSMTPSANQPYSIYNIFVVAPGYESVEISGAEILPEQLSIQEFSLMPLKDSVGNSEELYVIPPHTLYGDYPAKIAESEVKDLSESGTVVLSRVVIPEYVIVHDGPPSDSSAKNYYVKYKDYIKNVASSEIYATWPEETIYANILAIQSITLNRVYTEWYRNKGYDFTITSSTAYDQKWIPSRNIFDTIARAVDNIFSNYLSRPNVIQPLFTQYCDGRQVSCPNWMRQWESKDLGEQGLSPIEILRYFYGESIYINSSDEISGVPSSWPGSDLSIGSRGAKVKQLQDQLNVISRAYPLIPKVTSDGVYGEKTSDAVRVFQQIFKLPQTGVVDFPSWYKISEVFVGVSRIAEIV